MLDQSSDALQRWKGFDQAIDRWLDERHELIVLLSNFAASRDLSHRTPQLTDRLQAFISLLIDYISAGHFEFYQQLIEEGREYQDTGAVATGVRLLKIIDASTQQALEFESRYDQSAPLTDLAADLSELAETLASRFTAEDQMISILHDAHLARKTG
ncbi:MAG: hypothetical protein VR73_15315 [Gammaproteobacteria bacterium BRH_c0]|nr:MAG: hypothetical protein VR73_15315 [Gammaproteobacteria bacterium BRH_c0]